MMKKLGRNLIALSLVAFGSVSMASCKKKGGETVDPAYFSFSIGIKSGASTLELGSGKTEYVEIYNNGIDTANRQYIFASSDDEVATIDQSGKITPVKAGRVNFIVTETVSGLQKVLKRDFVITESSTISRGGYNYSGGTSAAELAKRAEILGVLEKYAMDTHLTGITLFDNGGYVKYADRVEIPTTGQNYVEGYGFGIISEGRLNGTLPGDEGKKNKPDYYHGAIGQDSLKINQYSATGSQVSDLASYITATYWNARLQQAYTPENPKTPDNPEGEEAIVADNSKYEWYPCLAVDKIKVPTFDEHGDVTEFAASKTRHSAPIPAEEKNTAGLYKKWRIYVKTSADTPSLKYKTASSDLQNKGFNNRPVTLEDYEFIYQLLFTGSNNITRGTEMANDTSYGIKGAQQYFNDTKNRTNAAEIQEIWEVYRDSDKLGIHTGTDINGSYIDIELINAVDDFTAMYTLSSSLVSPLPRDLFVGSNAIAGTMKDSIKLYGTFNNRGDNAILDYTLCLGAFTLESWAKNAEIVFARNDEWFETEPAGGNRYHIPGIYYRVIDTSTDTEKNWKQLEAGNLDSAGVPTSKVQDYIGKPNVRETKGDATFKLNVNSCTKAEWNKLFGPNGTISPNSKWTVKEWMSNSDFLDGLFYSIDREAFAKKRGMTPSINYFSDAYQMRNKDGGSAYNQTDAHKNAVKGYSENYGYSLDKATDCFRNAVKQLSESGKLVLGSRSNPTVIEINIIWMYQTDTKEYGEDIKYYFEQAFNHESVSGGRVKLNVTQSAVTNWEDVYTEMMKGQFDLGFGAISGNTYNPLNFLEVLKSDNSSGFTLNWGTDTSKVDEKNPIVYDGKKWSFDALWEVADHGGIVENGEKIKPVKKATVNYPTEIGGTKVTNELYNGFDIVFPVEFAEFNEEGSKAEFDVDRYDVYVFGRGNITIGENGASNFVYDKAHKCVRITVTPAVAETIDKAIYEANGFKPTDNDEWHKHPFLMDKYDELFSFELYYSLRINNGSTSITYYPVELADE